MINKNFTCTMKMWPENTKKSVLSQIYNDYHSKGYFTKKYVARDFPNKVVLILLLEEVTKVYKLSIPEQILKDIQTSKEQNDNYLLSYDPLKLYIASKKYFVPKRIFNTKTFVQKMNETKEKEKKEEEEEEEKEEEEEEKDE